MGHPVYPMNFQSVSFKHRMKASMVHLLLAVPDVIVVIGKKQLLQMVSDSVKPLFIQKRVFMIFSRSENECNALDGVRKVLIEAGGERRGVVKTKSENNFGTKEAKRCRIQSMRKGIDARRS